MCESIDGTGEGLLRHPGRVAELTLDPELASPERWLRRKTLAICNCRTAGDQAWATAAAP